MLNDLGIYLNVRMITNWTVRIFFSLSLIFIWTITGAYGWNKGPKSKLDSVVRLLGNGCAANFYVDKDIHNFYLPSYSISSAFHLISHGKSGYLYLNDKWCDATEIVAFLHPLINLKPDIKYLNIYGCEFAKGKRGLAAVTYLEQKLGLKVAASNNITGSDGDWNLEVGEDVTALIFRNYRGNLQYASGDDFDADGITNLNDIDDDNDGVLDIVENCENGLTGWTAFRSLSKAKTVSQAGIYFFNIAGNAFSTYVDANGYVQVAIDFGNGSGMLPTTNVLSQTTRGLLNVTILLGLTDIGTVRISSSSSSAGGLDIRSSNVTVIDRVRNSKPVGRGLIDVAQNSSWEGTNSARATSLNQACTSPYTSLANGVFHACYDFQGLHWVPAEGFQRINFNTGEIANVDNMRLWVLGKANGGTTISCDFDNDGIPNGFDLDSDGDGCPDLVEGGVNAAPGVIPDTLAFGTLVNNTPNTSELRNFARIKGPYGSNGFANSIQTDESSIASFSGSYNYSKALNAADSGTCNMYKPDGEIVGGSICLTENGQLIFNQTAGNGPYSLVINGIVYSGIISGIPFNVNPMPAVSGAYHLTKITDANNYSNP